MSDAPGLLDLFFGFIRRLLGAGRRAAVPAPGAPEAQPLQISGGAVDAPPGEPASVRPAEGISLAELLAIMPHQRAGILREYQPYLDAAMVEFEITTPLRAAAFLAQLAHESGELRYMEEIASGAAYEGRADLGNTQPGDGKRFKGRGPIQLTGRANYRACGAALGLDLEGDPAQAVTPQVGFRIAGWYWITHPPFGDRTGDPDFGCNHLADVGDFEGITRAINGGLNGLADRERYYAAAKEVLGA